MYVFESRTCLRKCSLVIVHYKRHNTFRDGQIQSIQSSEYRDYKKTSLELWFFNPFEKCDQTCRVSILEHLWSTDCKNYKSLWRGRHCWRLDWILRRAFNRHLELPARKPAASRVCPRDSSNRKCILFVRSYKAFSL